MQQQYSVKRIIIMALLAFTVISVVISLFSYFAAQKSQYAGEELQIANLGEFTRGKPSDKQTVDYIKHSLFLIVNINAKSPVASNSIDDILVRDGTFTQTYSKETDVHDVGFLVDIASIKQSYRLSYQWVTDVKNRDNTDQYGTMALCPSKEELRYGDFNCKELLSGEDVIEPDDPILQYLPHSDSNYQITLDPDLRKTLNVTLQTSAADERIDPDAAIASYRQAVRDWITSVGLDPGTYTINYTVIRASLY